MYKILPILLLSAMLPLNCSSAPLNDIMHQLGEKLLVVFPRLYASESDSERLKSEIEEIKALFEQATPHLTSDPGSRANYDLLMAELERASEYADTASHSMLKADLREAIAVCGSCHRQDRRFVRDYGISKFRDMDEFLAAEYGFMTRDYASALSSYRNFLAQEPTDSTRIQTALDHLLVVTLEIQEDPELAANTYKAIQPYLAQHREFSALVEERLASLAALTRNPADLNSPLVERDIDAMGWYLSEVFPLIRTGLSFDQQFVYWVAIRGQLNQLLRAQPGTASTPQILYWLAVSDRALQYRFYNSLSRRYLTQCIRDYPGHPYAQECFKEYEMMMIVSFSGSGGVYLPDEAIEEIESLRKVVYGNRSGNDKRGK